MSVGLRTSCRKDSPEVLKPPGGQEGQGGCRFWRARLWPSHCLLTSQKPQATSPTVYLNNVISSLNLWDIL